jgi:REP element-mobilizing transposase RayT
MARPLRIEFENAIYHVCARGNARQLIFAGDNDYARFVDLLAHSGARFGGIVLGFVLMPNHFHLIVQTIQPNLSRWMHWLILSYSVYFNREHRRPGHLFQGRYKSLLVENGDYLLELSRYIHLNPVRGSQRGRGTPLDRRQRLRSFKWSSYRGYAGLTKPFGFVDQKPVLNHFARTTQAAKICYRRFAEEGLVREIENPLAAVQWQIALGGEGFLRRIRDRITALPSDRRELTSVRQATEFIDPNVIVRNVAIKFNLAPERLTSPKERGSEARNVAMWIVSELCGLKLQEIGNLFGGLDYAAVAQRIRRTRLSYSEDTSRSLIAEMSNVQI